MSITNIQRLVDLISTAKAIYSDLTLSIATQTKAELKRFLTDSADFTEVARNQGVRHHDP